MKTRIVLFTMLFSLIILSQSKQIEKNGIQERIFKYFRQGISGFVASYEGNEISGQ